LNRRCQRVGSCRKTAERLALSLCRDSRRSCFALYFCNLVSTISWFFAGNSTSGIIARSVRALLCRCVQEKEMNAMSDVKNPDIRKETDSLGEVDVPADRLWGAQTQRSLEHFSIGQDLIPREMITAYAILKIAAATANPASKRLQDQQSKLIVQTCDDSRGLASR